MAPRVSESPNQFLESSLAHMDSGEASGKKKKKKKKRGRPRKYEANGTRGRSGGMSVSLAGPDGRVVGGGVAGLLIAATPIQVVVGSFVTNDQQENEKPRKQKVEHKVMPLASPQAWSNPEREQLPS